MSKLESLMHFQIRAAGLPEPERQFKALPDRNFRWDFGWRSRRLLLEVQGGTFAKDRTGHSTGAGISRDCEKANLAVLAGWRVLTVDTKQIHDGRALAWLQQALA